LGYRSSKLEGSTHSFIAQLLKEEILKKKKLPDLENITQLHKTYIIAEVKKGYLLLDQHAAAERILYEKFVASFEEKRFHMKTMSPEKPLFLKATPAETILLEDNKELFEKLGFLYEEFGKNTFSIISFPSIYKDRTISTLLKEILADISENKKAEIIDKASYKTLVYLACRSAVKAGDILTAKEMKILILELFQCKSPYTCPHGRPTYFFYDLHAVHTMFKRI
jgi:DNA mismatch repair protein MutL